MTCISSSKLKRHSPVTWITWVLDSNAISFFALSDRGCMKSKIASSYCPTHRPPPTAILSMLLSGHVQHLYRFTIARLDQNKLLFSFTSPPAISSCCFFPQAAQIYSLSSLHLESTTSMAEAFWSVVPAVTKRSGKRSCSHGNLFDDYSMAIPSWSLSYKCSELSC